MLREQPLVSVFMPTYNHEEYIAEAIESVISQDYPNLEIVVCDDFSTDKTAQIVQQYAEKYPGKIRAIFNDKNLGITPTCNVTLKHCTGKYIAYSSGDDLFFNGKIKKQVDAMEMDKSVVLSYHDVEVFLSESNETLRFWNHGGASAPAISGTASDVVAEVVAKDTSFMSALSIMVRRDAVPIEGYDERIPIASDWFMWIEILAQAGDNRKVVYIPDVLARHRRHDSNITNDINSSYEDRLVTLALTEGKYPWLIDEVKKNRSKIHYAKGVRLIRNGNPQLGRKYLKSSLNKVGFSRYWLRWYAAGYMPILLKSKREILGLD